MPKKLTQELAISKMKSIWDIKYPNHYSYDNFVYMGNHIKSWVTCHKHGDFLINLNSHIRKERMGGCVECSVETNSKKFKLTQEQAISRMKAIWDIKDPGHYSYENFVYTRSSEKSFVTCNKTDKMFGYHGDFLISLNNHTNDSRRYMGCKKCGIVKVSSSRSIIPEEAIKTMIKIHKDVYSYKNFIFKGATEKSFITCTIHGDFLMSYDCHTRKNKA